MEATKKDIAGDIRNRRGVYTRVSVPIIGPDRLAFMHLHGGGCEMRTHTPGPWLSETVKTQIGHCHKIHPINACLYVDHRDTKMLDKKTVTARADAQLMASAPDMALLLAAIRLNIIKIYEPTGEFRFNGLMVGTLDQDWSKVVHVLGRHKIEAAIHQGGRRWRMSVNCIRCIQRKRDGNDLLCAVCRRGPDLIQEKDCRDVCEWCPEAGRACLAGDAFHGLAEQLVGARGQWRLCSRCAALPFFSAYKKRVALAQGAA